MPKNNNLEPINFPQKIKFYKTQKIEYKNNLSAIKVKLVQSPSFDELLYFLPKWVKATWMENVCSTDNLLLAERWAVVWNVFHNKTLPSAKETINLVFEIDGISLQEVTHILRHRNAAFSADCSADKWWIDKDCLVPYSIENSKGVKGKINDDKLINYEYENIPKDNFEARYKKLTELCKELYCDMIDTKKISILDARYILPRNLSTFYYMRINLNDVIRFIHQRIDRQIQPETDNVIAYLMYLEILKEFPVANGMIDLDEPALHYINTARSGKSSNIYPPEQRKYVCGTDGGKAMFEEYFKNIKNQVKILEEKNNLFCKVQTGMSIDEIKKIIY